MCVVFPGEPSIHGQLQGSPPGPDQGLNVRGSDGFWARRSGTDSLEVGHQSSPAVYRHLLPDAQLPTLHTKAVSGEQRDKTTLIASSGDCVDVTFTGDCGCDAGRGLVTSGD